eukprot:gene42794-42380_t
MGGNVDEYNSDYRLQLLFGDMRTARKEAMDALESKETPMPQDGKVGPPYGDASGEEAHQS